jgi:capsular polysaccharide transport system permease protein
MEEPPTPPKKADNTLASPTSPEVVQNGNHNEHEGKNKKRSLVLFGVNLYPGSERKALAHPVHELGPVIDTGTPPPPRGPSFLRRHAMFLACVMLPTLLSIGYFGFYASDIYVSEASYIVRSPNAKKSSGGLSALLGGGEASFSRAQDDIFTINAFVTSRDAMDYLNEKLNLSSNWKSPEIDLLHRFDPLGLDDSNEALYKYYGKRVESAMDPISGITTLKASVFSPREAFEINQLLLGLAEDKVNTLNDRARNDLIRFAEREVANAEDKAKMAAVAVSIYRNTQNVVDPEAQTALHFQHISALQQELVKTRSQLVQLKVFAPNSPHPPALELRQKTLENEIAKEMANITGGESSLASKAAEFERLKLEREFAAQQLASALASLEGARNEAQRQLLYLESIAKPKVPDTAILPRRFMGILSTFIVSFLIWGVLSMLVSGIKEHKS